MLRVCSVSSKLKEDLIPNKIVGFPGSRSGRRRACGVLEFGKRPSASRGYLKDD
jgi:hypothetical protein